MKLGGEQRHVDVDDVTTLMSRGQVSTPGEMCRVHSWGRAYHVEHMWRSTCRAVLMPRVVVLWHSKEMMVT